MYRCVPFDKSVFNVAAETRAAEPEVGKSHEKRGGGGIFEFVIAFHEQDRRTNTGATRMETRNRTTGTKRERRAYTRNSREERKKGVGRGSVAVYNATTHDGDTSEF